MYLGVRTDSPVAELYLYDGSQHVDAITWQADRSLAKGLLQHIETLLHKNDVTFEQLKGLFVFTGPGSFTGLRIGMTVMNTMSYALTVPIVGTNDEDWVITAVSKLERGETDEIVLPFYGAEPRITSPKK